MHYFELSYYMICMFYLFNLWLGYNFQCWLLISFIIKGKQHFAKVTYSNHLFNSEITKWWLIFRLDVYIVFFNNCPFKEFFWWYVLTTQYAHHGVWLFLFSGGAVVNDVFIVWINNCLFRVILTSGIIPTWSKHLSIVEVYHLVLIKSLSTWMPWVLFLIKSIHYLTHLL